MTPRHTKDASPIYDAAHDRRDDDRHADALKGLWFRRLKPTEILAGVGLTAGLIAGIGMLSTRFGPVATAITTETHIRAADVSRNSDRIDSLSRVMDVRFAAQDDRMTFMSYLLCEQSQSRTLTKDARQRCDTIIAKRMDP